VIVDHRPELDLLDLDHLLLLTGFRGFLLRRIFILPVVHDLADGRIVVRRNLNQIHAGIHGHLDRHHGLDGAVVLAGLIDQLDLRIADIIIDARPVFGGSGRGSIRTANGVVSNVVNEGRYFEAIRGYEQAKSYPAQENRQMRGISATACDIDTHPCFRKPMECLRSTTGF
jgi:hypothetical protein